MYICRKRRVIDARVLVIKPLFAAIALASAVPGARAQALSAPTVLPEVSVTVQPTAVEKYQLPATTESVTRAQMDESINVMNTEDALKY